jgi:phage-related protein
MLAPIPEIGYFTKKLVAPRLRPLYWVGSAKKDLIAMPQPVVRGIGMALGVAQQGGKHPSAKPWKGEGGGVFEIVCNFSTDTFQAVYAVSYQKAVYVLHCFQKKSPGGSKTARRGIDLIRNRQQAAQADYEGRYGQDTK